VQPTDRLISELRRVLVPLLLRDGATLHLVNAEANGIRLHLTGRYSGAPGLNLVIRRVIEPTVAKICPGAKINVSSGPLVPEGALEL
jgi:Fe-S cluster biogenesis protein NfuA